MKRSKSRGRPTVEIFKAATGKFQWQLRGPDGRIVEIKTGSVKLPKTTAKDRKVANSAVQHALGLAAEKSSV